MSEKLIERKLRKGVKALGGIALKFFSIAFTSMPDRIVLMPGGRIYFVELKSAGKTPSARQQVVIRFLKKLGFEVYIIADEQKLSEFLNLIKR